MYINASRGLVKPMAENESVYDTEPENVGQAEVLLHLAVWMLFLVFVWSAVQRTPLN